MSNSAFSAEDPAGNMIACIHWSLQPTGEENYKEDEYYKKKKTDFHLYVHECVMCVSVFLVPLGT